MRKEEKKKDKAYIERLIRIAANIEDSHRGNPRGPKFNPPPAKQYLRWCGCISKTEQFDGCDDQHWFSAMLGGRGEIVICRIRGIYKERLFKKYEETT